LPPRLRELDCILVARTHNGRAITPSLAAPP